MYVSCFYKKLYFCPLFTNIINIASNSSHCAWSACTSSLSALCFVSFRDFDCQMIVQWRCVIICEPIRRPVSCVWVRWKGWGCVLSRTNAGRLETVMEGERDGDTETDRDRERCANSLLRRRLPDQVYVRNDLAMVVNKPQTIRRSVRRC